MAGSYEHAVTKAGNLRSSDSWTIENLGDAYEMAEEMYGMIWWLARESDDPGAAVEEARQRYRDGLAVARRANRRGA